MPRASVPLDGEWEGASGHRVGRIGDISAGGCFVESLLLPAVGERVRVRVRLPGGAEIDALGEVAYLAMGMGFGLRFLDLTPDQQARLREAMLRLLA